MTDDEIAKLVEEKARALIAADKQRDADDKARAQRDEEAAKKAELHKADVAELAFQKAKVDENQAKARGVWFMNTFVAQAFAVLALIIGGIIFPACVEPIAGQSLFAGKAFCPSACPTCRGPGRVFTWHTSGGGYNGNVSRQLCHNGEVDVDKLTWMDVTDEKKQTAYQLTMWASVPLDAAFLFVFFCVFGPFFVARFRNKNLNSELAERGQKIVDLERKLAPATAESPPEPYR